MTKPENRVEAGKTDAAAELFEWAESLVKALLFIVLLFAFIARLTGVEGTSMVPTLHERDYLLISDLFYEPKPGDIVVMTKAGFLENDRGRCDSFVKRVIAVGGQTVDIDFSSGTVVVDGEALTEEYVSGPTYKEGDMVFPLTVPDGSIFVLGDNRGASTDSRWSMVGLVDERCIVGRVLLRLWPLTKIGTV